MQGGGTRDIGRPVVGELLEVGITGVELYEPGALTLVVRAGTPLAEIEALLAGEGQRLAFEPMDHRVLLGTEGVPTIGGVVAANVSGPRRIQAGAARDFALGVRFVDGAGRVHQERRPGDEERHRLRPGQADGGQLGHARACSPR